MLERIKKFLETYNLQDKTLIVGFSGGYDSMCLLDILSQIAQEDAFKHMKLIAAHFNHNWRGEESLKEQEVCKLFAASKGIEFYTETASGSIKKTENDARIARYNFFDATYKHFNADAVLTAHNKDDNAETLLYRITKGTGLFGLKGISEKREHFYRPLLKTTRKEILEYCNINNLTPNNDSSNYDTIYNRNYIRHEIMPQLEKINPAVKDALNTLSEVAKTENAIIEEYINTLKPEIFDNDRILSQRYKNLSEPVKKRIIHEYIQRFNIDYDFKRIKELYDFIEVNITKRNGSTISLATAKWLYVDDKIIETIPRTTTTSIQNQINEININTEGEFQFKNRKIVIRAFNKTDKLIFPDSTANYALVDLSNVPFPLKLRTRQDGDIISPFGMTGTMKLKKYMNSRGITRHVRDDVIVLATGNEVLWAVEIGINNKIGVTKYPTHVLEVL